MTDIDKKILTLWHDSKWKGSFTGVKTFQTLLKTDKNINISENKLYSILKTDSLYLKHLKPHRKINRRSYNLNFYGELIQGDVAYMFEDNNYQYFLTLIDCYSLKVFCAPLKSKSSNEVLNAFVSLLEKFKTKISKVEVDQGTEFSKVKIYCQNKNILFKYKFGNNKANFAEWIIMVLKRRLYKILRDKQTHNWTKYLKQIYENFNDIPQKKIGYLKPNEINSIFDSVKVRNERQDHNLEDLPIVSYQQQKTNQNTYENKKNTLQVNDYVYLDFKQTLFGKSFDVQVVYSIKKSVFLYVPTKK